MSFFQLAKHRTLSVTQKILRHPFILEITNGSLPWDIFSYYLEQDKLYLEDYARCLSVIAKNSPPEYQVCLSCYVNHTVKDEQDDVYGYYDTHYPIKKTGLVAPATLSYTSYLLRTCINEPLEVAVAAVLPCFWLYNHIGSFAKEKQDSKHIYNRWVEVYSSDSFGCSTDVMVEIFNTLAAKATPELQKKMLDAYERGAYLEGQFFDDTYHQRVFDGKVSLLSN